tara:strand:+ start:315 stop:602 length:288 start_codon:yes stop_codon:yes gene_type:complete
MKEEVVKEIQSHMRAIEEIVTENCPEAQYMFTVQMDSEKEDEAMDVFYGVRADNTSELIEMFENVFELVCAENPSPEKFKNFLDNFGIMGASGEA